MTDNNFAKQALTQCKSKYECHFDSSLLTIKRNLLFVSLLSFASLAVAPKNGEYSVNLGVISGVIEEPSYIYVGLVLVCAYHIYYYWISCRQAMFNASNFSKIEEVYMFELAGINAFNEWHTLIKQYLNNENMGVGNFTRSPNNPRENGGWKVRAEVQSDHLNRQKAFLKSLQNHKFFSISEDKGFSIIDYIYIPQFEDYNYLTIHKDQFWLTKKKEFIEYVFPILVGYVALISLIYRVVGLS